MILIILISTLLLTPPRTTPTSSPLPDLCPILGVITHLVQFVLPIYSWVWGHPLECGQSTSTHTIRKHVKGKVFPTMNGLTSVPSS